MASLDDPGDVREGFLCPLCLKDLQSFYQLQSHYEEEHSGEDRDVKGQIKSLFQKAKKAKNKLLRREGDEQAEPGAPGYESFSNGGVDPYMWEPQELGTMRSHLSEFKKHRAARIDHYVVEVNKLIIRLEKLTAFDRTNTESAKIRAIEKSVVPWVNDQDVPFCPDCGSKFSIRNRRHHCRLCGSIMCKKCMELISLLLANKLTSASRDALSTHTSPNQSPGSVHGSRRGSIGSVSSMSSVLDEKENERIRCCRHCKDTLLRREQQMDEREHTPAITRLYEKLRLCMAKVDQKAPEYTRMAASLNAGETTYSLEQASDLRLEVQKMYELIDALSKKILTLGLNQDPPPHPTTLRLQRMIRYSATLFVQEKLLGLMSLPTKEQFEELKKKRKQDMERKRMLERQAAPESQCRLEDKQRGPAANGEVAPTRKAEGWLPLPETQGQREDPDPLLQQIHNIESFIKQAQAASRTDEVRTLGENLRQLQDEYDRQQTAKAIELSRRQAEEEALQCEQLQRLREREWERERERERKQAASLHSRTQALDSREAAPFLLEPSRGPRPHPAFALELGSSSGSGMAPETPSPCAVWALSQESLHQSTEPQQNDCALNSFSRDFFSSPAVVQAKLPREYNPFEEEEEEEEEAEEERLALEWALGADEDFLLEHIRILKVLWCFLIHVQGSIRQFAACLVLTDFGIAVFEIPHQESRGSSQHILSSLRFVFCFPHGDLTEFGFLMPELCLVLKVRHSENTLFIISDAANLQEFHADLRSCFAPQHMAMLCSPILYSSHTSLQEFLRQLLTFYKVAGGCQERSQGCFPVYLVYSDKRMVQTAAGDYSGNIEWASCTLCSAVRRSCCAPSEAVKSAAIPYWLLLTPQHLNVIKADFNPMPNRGTHHCRNRNSFKLSRVPLSTVLLDPTRSCTQPRGAFADGHVLELLVGYRFVTAIFVLPHEKFHFLRIYNQLRASLQDLKTVVIAKTPTPGTRSQSPLVDGQPAEDRARHDQRPQEGPAEATAGAPAPAPVLAASAPVPANTLAPAPAPEEASAPAPTSAEAQAPPPAPAEASAPALVPEEAPIETPTPAAAEALTQAEAPAQYPSEQLIQSTSEENQIPFHLPVCPSLQHIAGLSGKAVIELFHSSIAEVENEELRHLLWSSVVFYQTPGLEVTACVLLSTKAVYFVLHDGLRRYFSEPLQDFWHQKNTDYNNSPFHISQCFVLKLSDLQSVNVGLFDQHFRLTGSAPAQVVTCLTRDSYLTHCFLQHLMLVLSSLERTPSPEPADKDFYSEFGDKTTGKMENYELIHSSRVKFTYPSEEEVGDLTYIVAQKTTDPEKAPAPSILLYVQAFQVDLPPPGSCRGPLRPKTLLLTSTEIFLLDEDYIHYPLPEFAKEPPQRDRYRLGDGHRVRDLDRVLMGYQPYPQALTLVFDDMQGHDLMGSVTLDHFGEMQSGSARAGQGREIQWQIFVPSAESREKLISLLARQWEALCGRELPVELTG